MNNKNPKLINMRSHKRRLKVALLSAHEKRSSIQSFVNFIIDNIKIMSLGKKSTAIATLTLAIIIVGAGIFGPTASEVAQAEAVTTVKRAFARFANLSEEDKAELQEKFQDKVHFREDGEPMFHGMLEMTIEEREAKHAEMKASLADSLIEAQAAEDLEVIIAEEMPKPGFMGKAGRAFGFKMMQEPPKDLENLSQEIQDKIKEHEEQRVEMQPVKWLKYTNSEGKIVKLGLNAQDEPVMKFVEGEIGKAGFGASNFGGHKGMDWIGKKDIQ